MAARVGAASSRSPRLGLPPQAVTIVLADHHHLIRQGVRLLLEIEKDLEVVGEVADGLKVAGLVERSKPHVLVVASTIPGLSSFEIVLQVRQRSPETAIIVLSSSLEDQYVVEALRSGASGYVVTQARGSELVRAIRKVAAGIRYVSSPFSDRPMDTWLQRARIRARDPFETLTRREREVFDLVAEGHSNASIANRLSISRRTAETHRANVMTKLELTNQAGLIRLAIARGISVVPSKPPNPPRAPRRSTPS